MVGVYDRYGAWDPREPVLLRGLREREMDLERDLGRDALPNMKADEAACSTDVAWDRILSNFPLSRRLGAPTRDGSIDVALVSSSPGYLSAWYGMKMCL